MVVEEVIASVGFYAFEKLEFHLLVSLKSRSSHFSIEIQDLLTVEHPCVLRPLRCGKVLVALVFLVTGRLVVQFVFFLL